MKSLSVEQITSSHWKSSRVGFFLLASVAGLAVSPDFAWAFQGHPSPEGLYAHQLAHVFFAVSMGLLAYWLHRNRLTNQAGWLLIQVSCVLFVAWNAVAFAGHWVEELISASTLQWEPGWSRSLAASSSPWTAVYFVLKLDHLLCVPAILCLIFGLRSLYKQVLAETQGTHD